MNAVDEHPIATSSFEHQGPRWAMPPGRTPRWAVRMILRYFKDLKHQETQPLFWTSSLPSYFDDLSETGTQNFFKRTTWDLLQVFNPLNQTSDPWLIGLEGNELQETSETTMFDGENHGLCGFRWRFSHHKSPRQVWWMPWRWMAWRWMPCNWRTSCPNCPAYEAWAKQRKMGQFEIFRIFHIMKCHEF